MLTKGKVRGYQRTCAKVVAGCFSDGIACMVAAVISNSVIMHIVLYKVGGRGVDSGVEMRDVFWFLLDVCMNNVCWLHVERVFDVVVV